ncbi:hypothetical protein ABZV34_26690 [Streptomyces sp. NPDC005195]|uniref:hypothetical protein n=1 Tax=Streptomyces sp. NPDC005195 TaxID=3154561 RepID=UPI0033BB79EB
MSEVYAFIEAEKTTHSVALLCRLLKVALLLLHMAGRREGAHGEGGRRRRPGTRSWLNLATREIVGYSMADQHRASLVVVALRMAAGRGRLQP